MEIYKRIFLFTPVGKCSANGYIFDLVVVEYMNGTFHFDWYDISHSQLSDTYKNLARPVPEDIVKKFEDYISNPFFEIDKQKYLSEHNLMEVKDVGKLNGDNYFEVI